MWDEFWVDSGAVAEVGLLVDVAVRGRPWLGAGGVLAPTSLSLGDLWDNPIQVAQHLSSLAAFNSLPPLELQGPRPPPEPPPGE